jgi:hypothetical protein
MQTGLLLDRKHSKLTGSSTVCKLSVCRRWKERNEIAKHCSSPVHSLLPIEIIAAAQGSQNIKLLCGINNG